MARQMPAADVRQSVAYQGLRSRVVRHNHCLRGGFHPPARVKAMQAKTRVLRQLQRDITSPKVSTVDAADALPANGEVLTGKSCATPGSCTVCLRTADECYERCYGRKPKSPKPTRYYVGGSA